MHVSQPREWDNMEMLYKQNKLHNQGARMEEEEKAQETPQENQACAIPLGTPPPKVEHRSTKEPPLQVPIDRLSELYISKMDKSQENPYLHLLDKEVNQSAKQKDKDQPEVVDLPMEEQVFQDLPDIDHMSKLKGDDFKAFEAVKE